MSWLDWIANFHSAKHQPQIEPADLLRVNVVGNSGSGKSTFARQLATALGSEYVEMDFLFHGPNWTEPELGDFRERVRLALLADRWVLDGNYHSKTVDLKWRRATLVVWMDTSFVRNMWQAICRALNRCWTKKELWPNTGNRETFQSTFLSRDSMILWALKSYHPLRERYAAMCSDPRWSHLRFVRLRSKQDAAELIGWATLAAEGGSLKPSSGEPADST